MTTTHLVGFEMDVGQVIELIALLGAGVGTLGGTTWALVGYINSNRRDLDEEMKAQDEKRSQNVAALHLKIEQAASTLDEKFNALNFKIDQVKDSYVRRDDLDRHIGRIELSQRDTTEAVNRLRTRLDEIVVKLIDTLQDRRGARSHLTLDEERPG